MVIKLTGITFGYSGQAPVLENLDLTLNAGERLGLVGQNGGGKTTLLHIIMGLLKAGSGQIEIFGRPIKTQKDFCEARTKIGFLFQDADDQLFCPSVIEDVAFGPLNLGISRADAIAVARYALASLGLTNLEGRATHRLSGGEKRLVCLAAVLAMSPKVLLLDEPTSGLDENAENRLVEILPKLNLSYIIVSHSKEFLAATTGSVVCLSGGKILPVTGHSQGVGHKARLP